MSTLTDDLKSVVQEARVKGLRPDVLRIKLKETLQPYVLDYIYNSDSYKNLTFYGGTCLRICFNLNRMSEDVDFETTQNFDKGRFAKDIKEYFSKKIQYKDITTHVPGKGVDRIELRFPVLYQLKLTPHENENLIVKVEVNKKVSKEYPTDFKTIAIDRFGFVVRHYILQVLMAGKVLACLDRQWEKSGVKIKGRDFYDLVWYMQEGVVPDQNYLADSGYTVRDALKKLRQKTQTVKSNDLLKDLSSLFENKNFSQQWSHNFKTYFSLLEKKYQTAPIDKNINLDVYQYNDFDTDTFHIRIRCKNVQEKNIVFIFSFSEEWVDDESPQLNRSLQNLCCEKVEEYINKMSGEEIIPARYPTKVMLTPATKKEDETSICLKAKEFADVPLEELINRRNIFI